MVTSNLGSWNPTDGKSWAQGLGLVYLPLLPSTLQGEPGFGDCAALLDGRSASFSLFSLEDSDRRQDRWPVSSSWSAYLRHVVIVDEPAGTMYLTRWDADEGQYWERPVPDSADVAEALLQKMQEAPAARRDDAVTFALRAFRRLRDSLPDRPALDAIRIFNALLVGMEAVRRQEIKEKQWTLCRTVGDALSALCDLERDMQADTGIADLSQSSRASGLDDMLKCFLAQEPTTGFRLEPGLLLRHAAGQLYQEAHIQIARDDRLRFPGMWSDARPKGATKRDIHFTPVPLARALVEQAFDALGRECLERGHLDVLDPACGSGVFLQEALRELESRGYEGRVTLRGMDLSQISCAMARFCVSRAREEAQRAHIDAEVIVEHADALAPAARARKWGKPDLVLMNPPFAGWRDMPEAERAIVAQVLGSEASSFDKSMAFIELAACHVAAGGVISSVLPAPILGNQTGASWRERLRDRVDLCLIGRFRGIGYFKSSALEPGFLVLRQPVEGEGRRRESIRLVVAEPGGEEGAIRALRRLKADPRARRSPFWDIYDASPEVISPQNWLPLSARAVEMVETLKKAGTPRVRELFDVRQGARTGANPVFVQAARYIEGRLPPDERHFFRPSAGSGTIQDGRLIATEYVFYPYDDRSGLLVTSKEDLRSQLGTYYRDFLLPDRDRLEKRKGLGDSPWWALTRERGWQHKREPKLISKYFGRAGDFAFDETGDYVVVQGCAWFWRGAHAHCGLSVGFLQSELPYAYLALLNSVVFEAIVGCVAPRVAGGQYNLSHRFVSQAFIPDLTRTAAEVVDELARLGKSMHSGGIPPGPDLTRVAAQAYRVPAEEILDLSPE